MPGTACARETAQTGGPRKPGPMRYRVPHVWLTRVRSRMERSAGSRVASRAAVTMPSAALMTLALARQQG